MNIADPGFDTLDTFDPDAAGIGRCPYPAFARLREERPVHRVPATGHCLVSRYEDVLAVLKDPATFSNDHDLILRHHGDAIGWVNPGHADVADIYAGALPNLETLHFLDPPAHTRQRRRINRWFTSKRAQTAWQPMAEELVDDLIDGFVADGRFELMGQFAATVPIRVIGAILGIDTSSDADIERIRRWSDAFVSSMGVDLDHDGWKAKAQAHVETQQFFLEQIRARAADPTDDLLSELVQASIAGSADGDDEPFTELEIVNAMQHLLAAGNETTSQAIGLLVQLLVEHPAELAKVRADPSLIQNAVEEALRMEPPTLGMWRYCRTDAVVGGVTIPAGSMVILLFGAANRDEAVFTAAEEFRVDRPKALQHLAFGHGIHFCVGAGLARMEVQVAVTKLLERLPGLRVAQGAEPTFGESWLLRNLRSLELEFDIP